MSSDRKQALDDFKFGIGLGFVAGLFFLAVIAVSVVVVHYAWP